MKQRAALLWKVELGAVSFECGVFRAGDRSMTCAELAQRLEETGGPVIRRGTVNPAGAGGSFAGAIVDVEVDPETGKVRIVRFTALQDAGRAVYPTAVGGQMRGGSARGIGWALREEFAWMSPGHHGEPQPPGFPWTNRARCAAARDRYRGGCRA